MKNIPTFFVISIISWVMITSYHVINEKRYLKKHNREFNNIDSTKTPPKKLTEEIEIIKLNY